MNTLLLVGITGGLGATLRFALTKTNGRLPWGILLANTIAAGIVGFSFTQTTDLKTILVAGLAGGLSTFSTLIANTADFWLNGKWRLGWLNLTLNVVFPSTFAFVIGSASLALLK